MPDSVDDTIFTVSALDNFSETFDDLEESLMEAKASAEMVDPVELGAAIAEGMADIETFKRMIDSIDDDVTVDIDTDTDVPWEVASRQDRVDMMRMQTGQPLWETNPFDPQEGGALFSRSETATSDRGNLNAPDFRELIFGQREPISGGDMIPGEEIGGVAFPSRNERRFDPLREAINDFKDLRLSMGMFMNVMASLFPLLGIFVGALPAAIAGVGALAAAAFAAGAALYGLAGLGVIGLALEGGEFNFNQLQSRIQGMIDTFISAFGPLANAIEPMMLDLMSNIELAMFSVAQQMRPLLSLTDEARSIFNGLLSFIGPFVSSGIQFAEAFMPVLQLMGSVGGRLNVFNILADIIVETAPILWLLTDAIWNALPAIYQLSRGFLAFATVLTGAFSILLRVANTFPFLTRGVGVFVSVLLTALSATAIFSLLTGNLMRQMLGLAASFFQSVIPGVWSYASSMWGATGATIALTIATITLISVLTVGLGVAVGGLSTQFDVLGGNIRDATGSLKEFSRVGSRMSLPSTSMDDPSNYDRPSVSSSGTGGGMGSGSGGNTTVVAPDKETGNAVGHTLAWQDKQSETTSESDVNNRLHSN